MPAERFWSAFSIVTHGLARAVSQDPIDVLAISSHGETFVPVDDKLAPVAPAILNIDNRAVAQANWVAGSLGSKRIFDITGLTVHPMYPVPKILWIRENQPDVFQIGYEISRSGRLPSDAPWTAALHRLFPCIPVPRLRHSRKTVV